MSRTLSSAVTREKEIGYVVLISRIQQTAPNTSRTFLSNSILLLHPVPVPPSFPLPLSFADTSLPVSHRVPFDSPSRIGFDEGKQPRSDDNRNSIVGLSIGLVPTILRVRTRLLPHFRYDGKWDRRIVSRNDIRKSKLRPREILLALCIVGFECHVRHDTVRKHDDEIFDNDEYLSFVFFNALLRGKT